jgi:hypothetical protein
MQRSDVFVSCVVLGANLTKLRDEVVSAARATLIEHLGGQTESSDDSVAPVNEQGQVSFSCQ